MSLKESTSGPTLYGPTSAVNNLPLLAKRVLAQTDNAYDFFSKQKTWHGYLYNNITATIASDPSIAFYTGPCNEVTLQLIGTIAVTVLGSLDGTTFVTAAVLTTTEGFIRITDKYRYLQCVVNSITGTASVYMMIS